jgi:hypothetical protein
LLSQKAIRPARHVRGGNFQAGVARVGPSWQAIHGTMVTMDEPRVVAWFVNEPIDPADPLAAVKHLAVAIDQAAEVLAEVTQTAHVEARADAIDQAADLMMDDAFSPDETWEACEASGLPPGEIDSAGNVALTLWQIEHGDDRLF